MYLLLKRKPVVILTFKPQIVHDFGVQCHHYEYGENTQDEKPRHTVSLAHPLFWKVLNAGGKVFIKLQTHDHWQIQDQRKDPGARNNYLEWKLFS